MAADVFKDMQRGGHEEVVFCRDADSGLRAIIAVHSTLLGPGLGGVRMWPYASTEEALQDVLRLAEAMTYKAAAAGLPLGGGKAVIIGDPRRAKTESLLRAFGRAVESLGGRYLTAEDVGMTVADMEVVRKETRHVTGTSEKSGGSGDPSHLTAKGVFYAIETCMKELYGDPSVKNRTVAIQGVGKVGYQLAELLATADARLIIADTDAQRAMLARREFEAWRVEPDEILQVECDVLSPCALGGVFTRKTIATLRCRAIAGASNNQLDQPADADRLAERRILYAPDYVVNAGGIINILVGLQGGRKGYDRAKAERLAKRIPIALQEVFRKARAQGITAARAADELAEARLEEARVQAAKKRPPARKSRRAR
ncbi:MAG: Glu/Leu/Phe/Val dehydrogenase [Nitrospirae bacterium]|nr:MAG: Glu/Leu/Phe/Val dehydrogenase [Nitrospirota bacterium]